MLVLVAAGGAAARPQASLPFPSFSRAVPVLLYHGIVAGNGYGVPPAVFDAEMQRLHDLGFTAIPLSTYVRFMQGAHVVLPPRPILLTFDDGFVSSWQNA